MEETFLVTMTTSSLNDYFGELTTSELKTLATILNKLKFCTNKQDKLSAGLEISLTIVA